MKKNILATRILLIYFLVLQGMAVVFSRMEIHQNPPLKTETDRWHRVDQAMVEYGARQIKSINCISCGEIDEGGDFRFHDDMIPT